MLPFPLLLLLHFCYILVINLNVINCLSTIVHKTDLLYEIISYIKGMHYLNICFRRKQKFRIHCELVLWHTYVSVLSLYSTSRNPESNLIEFYSPGQCDA